MARKRPGDDAAGDRPDDEVYDAAEDDGDDAADSEPVRGGGTAVRERRPKEKKDVHRAGLVGVIGRFFREIIGELRKVIWPTRNQLVTYTIVVLVFVSFMVALVSLLDFLFGRGVLFLFGT